MNISAPCYKGHEYRNAHHERRHTDNVADILIVHTVIDDLRVQLGYEYLADDLNDHAQRTEYEIYPVWLDVFEPSFHVVLSPLSLE